MDKLLDMNYIITCNFMFCLR